MRNAWVFYQKEMLEMIRSYKLAWIPVVFIILGIMQPLATYYMPEILSASGDVPPGLLEAYEMPGAAATMVQTLGQYGTIGMLVLVLATMNSLSGERQSGTAELIQVRPVSPLVIVFAKWSAQLILLLLCLGLGTGAAAYYTWQLIGELSWNTVLFASGLYGIWLLCIVSLTLFFSSFLRAPAAAFLALLFGAGLSLLNSLAPSWLEWSPASLPAFSASILMEESNHFNIASVAPLVSAGFFILFCIAGASLLIGRKS